MANEAAWLSILTLLSLKDQTRFDLQAQAQVAATH